MGELLAEKARVAEEEAALLGKKASDAEEEIKRLRLCVSKVQCTRKAHPFTYMEKKQTNTKEFPDFSVSDHPRQSEGGEILIVFGCFQQMGTNLNLKIFLPYSQEMSESRVKEEHVKSLKKD